MIDIQSWLVCGMVKYSSCMVSHIAAHTSGIIPETVVTPTLNCAANDAKLSSVARNLI